MKPWGRGKSGIILISVLWILAILSVLALSLSRSSSLELSLTKHSVGRLRSFSAAWGGVEYVKHLLTHRRSPKDTRDQCGILIEQGQGEADYFKAIAIGKGAHADIIIGKNYGLEDEERKINVNALNEINFRVLSVLLQQVAGVGKEEADRIAIAVVDWHDEDDMELLSVQGNAQRREDGHYAALPTPYKVKNRPFDCVEELLMVQGMKPAYFKKIKSYVTVFPKSASLGAQLQVNFSTAPEAVINAMVGDLALRGIINDAKTAVRVIIDHRASPDHILSDSSGDLTYANLMSMLNGIDVSQFYHARVMGTDDVTGARSILDVVLDADVNSGLINLAAWRRQ